MAKYSNDHPHQLELKPYQKPYVCDGCREPGFGPRYRCDACDYSLHRECMFPISSPTSHPFFGKSPFRFFRVPQTKCPCPRAVRGCDGCGKSINGFSYHCREKGWDLHPCCIKLKPELIIDGVQFRLLDRVRNKCEWCGETKIKNRVAGIKGWSYVSKCKKYNLHVFCVTEMVSDALIKMNPNGCSAEKENQSLCLDKISLQIRPRYKVENRSSMYWKITKMLFNTLIGVLLGNPCTAVTLIIDLLS